ncbi:MAG: hypothetical protein H6641_09710 [Caldilineaceae bacterium]|nr:hypothetical protein [Caldilineaceae bacterium]
MLSHAELAELERNYRQTLIDQFEMLTFRGITPLGKALALKLADVYVELKTIADVPEAADTYSAEERRIMLEMQGEGKSEEIGSYLDTLRLERWRARRRSGEMSSNTKSAISETMNDPLSAGW